MSYLDRYRKRVSQHGTSYKEIALNQEREDLEANFTTILGHVEAQLNQKDSVDLVLQSTTNFFTKSAMLRPSDVNRVKSGDYLMFDDEFWLTLTVNKTRLSPVAELYFCNQRLCFPHVPEGVPCYASSTSFGTKGIANIDKFYELDSKTRLYVQKNEITNQLYLGYRFMFEHQQVYEITEIERAIYSGVYVITCRMVELCDMDDTKNNLAYNKRPLECPEPPKQSLEILGSTTVKRKTSEIYRIAGAVAGEWFIDNPKLADLIVLDDQSVELRFGSTSDWLTLTFASRRPEAPFEVEEATLDILIG